MNKDVKQRWVQALRRGKHKQARTTLHAFDESMCCLDVLCLVEFGDARAKQAPSGVEFLDDEYIDEIGLSYSDMSKLADMNDGKPHHTGNRGPASSFIEIADYIERNL